METDYDACSDCFLRRLCWAIRMHKLVPPKRLRAEENLLSAMKRISMVVLAGYIIVLAFSFVLAEFLFVTPQLSSKLFFIAIIYTSWITTLAYTQVFSCKHNVLYSSKH